MQPVRRVTGRTCCTPRSCVPLKIERIWIRQTNGSVSQLRGTRSLWQQQAAKRHVQKYCVRNGRMGTTIDPTVTRNIMKLKHHEMMRR